MEQPKDFKESCSDDEVYLLQKSVYELKQSARYWNQTIHDILIKSKFVQRKLDQCFYIYSEGELLAYMVIYVDDIPISSKEESIIVKVKNISKNALKIHNLEPIKCYFVLEISC